jgi:Ni,Fe-hydrogenase I cytochrome b subunit
MQPKKLRGTIIYIIALVGIIVSGFMIYNNLLQKEGYSYSEVITLFEEGKVSE